MSKFSFFLKSSIFSDTFEGASEMGRTLLTRHDVFSLEMQALDWDAATEKYIV